MPLTSPGNDDDTGENHQPTLRKNTAEPVEQTLKQNIISKEIADHCRRTNQSTRWTEHAPSGETENRLPRNIIEVQRYSHLD